MKKAILYLCLAAGLMSCAKELDMATVAEEASTVEETPAGVPMTFNITVSDEPETRAMKTAWAKDDVIYVIISYIRGKFLKMTYNGSGWDITSVGGEMLDEDFSRPVPHERKITALHFPVEVDLKYDPYLYEEHYPLKNGRPVFTYYLVDANRSFTVE